MDSPHIILAVDIGGTFTDIVAFDSQAARIATDKLLTSYPDPSAAVIEGVRRLLQHENIPPASIRYVAHGTTLIANTLIERSGAKTAQLATAGFRDAVEIGNEGRYDMYDLALKKPQPLAPRHLRFDVPERMLADGRVYTQLDEAALRNICHKLRALDIEAVAICFLHAYTNPAHELRALEIAREELPGAALSASHQVAPGMREYPRASTTIANAYAQPVISRYLTRLDNNLDKVGVKAPLNIMLSSGGTTTLAAARDFPIRLVESGPAGGALAGVYWGRLLGQRDVLAFDMGGTTAKAALTRQGELAISNQSEVAHVHRFKRGSGLPLMTPMIELIEIGAGGGSIARLNALGLPTVGPHSAGSSPGPAAYQLGGTQPTVTDADLLLGYLNPDYFAGGEIQLDESAAHDSFVELADKLDMPVERMAWGVHQLVNENMAAAARVSMQPSAGWKSAATRWSRQAARVLCMPAAWRRVWAFRASSSRPWLAWAALSAFSPPPSPSTSRAAMCASWTRSIWTKSTASCAACGTRAAGLCGRPAFARTKSPCAWTLTCAMSGRATRCAFPSPCSP